MAKQYVTIDGNEAAALIAHRTNEVIAIYPITPSSAMGELSDSWSNQGRTNLWGAIPEVIEMQSEAGAAGTVHGALQTGALTTTFTSSQGLLLMIPNMYKIAGELTATVFHHVAARSIAAQALSIFGDHSDVMAVRQTGFAILSANSVQEVMDFALIAQSATLNGRIPMLHFFDGFRTSHEINEVEVPDDAVLKAMLPDALIRAHRSRALTPDMPCLRGSSQNPDVYFQGRESVNPAYEAMPSVVQACFDRYADLTGRQYHLFEYHGADDADRMMILMGSGAEAAVETVDHLICRGEKVGVLKVRLFRPFSPSHLIAALPASTRLIAVLDRSKEPGADGEALYKDVVTALATYMGSGGDRFATMPRIIGGRYGLSSKEFTPGMIRAVFDELAREIPKNHFTIGIHDDLSHSSLEWSEMTVDAGRHVTRCMFYGLGSDGTVSANKNSIKMIGETTALCAQGYFVYDSKKAGAVTISHLRFGPEPIHSTYLIGHHQAHFIACHQPQFSDRYDMLAYAAPEGVFLLNSPHPADQVWHHLSQSMQQQIIEKALQFYIIDAYKVAADAGMGLRINTVMQTCFFAISGVLEKQQAIASIKVAVEKTYGRKGGKMVERNFAAIDAALDHLYRVTVPDQVSSHTGMQPVVDDQAPPFIRNVTGEMMAGRGHAIPVSLMPADGTWPLGTAAFEKRNLASEIPVWDQELCIHCGKCPFVCPHAAIRSKVFPVAATVDAPQSFKHVAVIGREFEAGMHISYQVAPEDCTGCGLCVDICPVRDKSHASRKALNMAPQPPLRAQERSNWSFFLGLPNYDRQHIRWNGLKGAMLAQPLFEFSGACVGCGETPYM